MFDSLVIANTIELLGGGVPSANPLCAGATFYLQPGADPGAPQPTTSFVAGLLLDGERVYGRRASNRMIKLPVWITAPTRQLLASAREVLQQAIDQDYFTITWTRDPMAGNPGSVPMPLLLDCFRAQPTVPVFNTKWEKQLLGQQVMLSIPALPYGRSATQVQVPLQAPVPANPPVAPPPTPVVLDAFAAISSVQCSQSTQHAIGPNSCRWDPDAFGDFGGQVTPLTYSASFTSPLNLTNMTSLQFWFGLGSRYYANLEYHGKTHGLGVYFTLTDTSGNTLSFSRSHLTLPVSSSAESPVFSRITVPIPQNSATFNYGSVASYSLEVINRSDRIRRLSYVTAYLDALTAYPGSQSVTPVTRGYVHTLYEIQGTARAPVTMSFQQPPSAGTTTTITATGPGTYTVPAGTSWLKVECIGGGGAGAGMTVAGMGPGGGGAEYTAELIFPASPGQVIPYVNGAGATAGATPLNGGNTVFGPAPGGTLQVLANGGLSVPTNGTVAGLGGSGSPNSVEYPGGSGRANPAGTFGGGGGSSGGSASAGNTPVGSGSVTFTTPGTFSGSGSGWLCPAGVTQVFIEVWAGGGGGGSGSASGNGAGGGGGEYRFGFVKVTPGTYYTFVVGSGGSGGTSGSAGSAGTLSSFTGDSGQLVSGNPGQGGLDTGWQGWGLGGTGGTSPAGGGGFQGGRGGNAYPYTGGGGSSAGPGAQGNSGSSPGGAPAPNQGGAGGNGSGAQNGVGQPGVAPGGGGGGTYNGAFAGGSGANGQVRITYPASTGAPTSSGGVAVTGGGGGGNGGGSPGSSGSAGSAPGGGGGGGDSSGTTVSGGAGGNGQIKITPYASQPFRNLIVHRPPLGAVKTFQPLVSVGGGADAPDGTHQYLMPQPITGVNADFQGTYTVYLVNSSWSGGSSSSTPRTITVSVIQFEYAGGPGYSTSTLPVTVAPNQVTNGLVTAGVLTLPIKAVAPDNLGGYYTVSVTDTNTSDRFFDCIFVDTMGQTIVINETAAVGGYINYYVDAPDPNVTIGRIMGSQGGRPNAISVMDNTPYMSGGALFVEPAEGDNQLFVYSADGLAPNASLAYFPCYYFDRPQ